MHALSVTYASSPSADLLIPTLEFKNEEAGVIRLLHNKKPKELSGGNNYVNLVIGFTEIPV